MMTKATTIRISPQEMKQIFRTVLIREKLGADAALQCAELFTRNSLDGINSHGVNRFARFVDAIRKGHIKPGASPTLAHAAGALEQWDGNLGPGPLNAFHASDRAMELARQLGIGLVSLAQTNHWMRGGTYGLHCAEKGFAFLGWTNTIANLPPWGSAENKLGNNPIVFAMPYNDEVILLDMALSQYSFGKLKNEQALGNQLPQAGGYTSGGELTRDPAQILDGGRALPIGFWKGAALSLLLDLFATVLSGGLSTAAVSRQNGEEYGVSQIFIAIDLKQLGNHPAINRAIDEIIQDYLSAEPLSPGQSVHFPGQNRKEIAAANLKNGIPVQAEIWEEIRAL
jgi:3-dehydro-L-gulonate 2-dehydrogenase